MIGQVGLIGTPDECLGRARMLADLGVDEAACLIDFGVETPAVMSSLEHVAAMGRALTAEKE
jgi:hypothetical protein